MLYRTLIFSWLLLIKICAIAQIGISTDVVNFLPESSLAKNIDVVNFGDNNAYVEVTPYAVEKPGTDKEQRIRIYNPEKSGIVVSPNHLIIPPHQHRYVRIFLTHALGNSERIYRINFIPKIAGVLIRHKMGKKFFGIHLIVGYGALVIANPQKPQPLILFSRRKQDLFAENRGNTNIEVLDIRQCYNHHCITLPGKRLYSGQHWKWHIPYAQPIIIKTHYLETYKKYKV